MKPPLPVPSRQPSLAHRLLVEAPLGVEVELPRSGTALENPHVYDAVARDLLREAAAGRVSITLLGPADAVEEGLIRQLSFRRER